MKSTIDQKIEDAFYYAVNFYNTNDRSLEKQQFCLTEMQKYGLDLDTCIRIQNPIMSVFQMGELMQIGSEITQQHLTSITNNIRQHLLGLQPTMQPDVIKEIPHIQPPNYNSNIQQSIVNIETNMVMDDYRGGIVLKNINSISMNNQAIDDSQLSNLTSTLKTIDFSLNVLSLYGNLITDNSTAQIISLLKDENYRTYYIDEGNSGKSAPIETAIKPRMDCPRTLTLHQNIKYLNLGGNNLTDHSAKIISDGLISGKMKNTQHIDVSGNNITETGWEYFATAVKKVQAKTVAIKVATADTLQDMKEFLNKGFKYYTQTHTPVATKGFQDELLGVDISGCDKTKKNVKEAFLTGVAISSVYTGNDILIFFAGAEAGAGALLSPDTANCLIEITGKTHDLLFNDAE